jgi:chemotaxis protein MotB
MAGDDDRADEIVIIRRRGGAEDDHHHGGVWKIAYADFMTAMMAFFLVMWLINASNTETKSSIASYFNPVKLTDNVARKKGLFDIDEKSNSTGKPKEGDGSTTPEKRGSAKSKSSSSGASAPEAKQPANKITPNERDALVPQPRSDGAGATGEAFRDPFNPLASARQLIQQLPYAPEAAASAKTPAKAAGSAAGDVAPSKQTMEKAKLIRRDVETAIKQLGLTSGPGLDITTEGETIVLSLTDTSTFGMFAIGSAKPSDDLVKLVQAITPAMDQKGGQLIIRGHTDSRPFPGAVGNNNWRLAMARAEAVYSMLIQAHVDDSRFERIEAYADRKPKDPLRPEAAVNRRIDILLRPVNP